MSVTGEMRLSLLGLAKGFRKEPSAVMKLAKVYENYLMSGDPIAASAELSLSRHPQALFEAVLTKGVIDAIAYAINHPGVVADIGCDEYSHLMDAFQDWIPRALIDHNQWWIGHYWSSARTCSECRELVHLFRDDALTPDQRLMAAGQRNFLDHGADCSARKASSFSGVRVCLSLNSPVG